MAIGYGNSRCVVRRPAWTFRQAPGKWGLGKNDRERERPSADEARQRSLWPLQVRRSKGHTKHMTRRFGLLPCAAALACCAALGWGQRPADADSAAIIENGRQKALDYAQSLPDFVCSEIIQRYAASAWVVKLGPWVHTDPLTVKLSYSHRTEGHKLELIDGKPTDRKFEDLDGATSSGEFGGIRTPFSTPIRKPPSIGTVRKPCGTIASRSIDMRFPRRNRRTTCGIRIVRTSLGCTVR